MAWSGGNYTKGNNATGGWVGDASLGIGIEAGRHDTQDNDFATGINQCVNKDGSNAFTGNANLGGYIPTNIGAGTAAAPAICAGNDVDTGIFSAAANQIGVSTNGVERIRIDSAGRIGINTTPDTSSTLDISSTITNTTVSKYSADTDGTNFIFKKSRGAINTNTIVQANDNVAAVVFQGANGTGWNTAGAIGCAIDGTPGLNDMPGRLTFSTTPDGSAISVERMRIDNAGKVGVGGTAVGRLHTFSTLDDDTVYVETTASRPTIRYARSGTVYAGTWVDGGGFVTGSANSYGCRAGSTGGVYLAPGGISWSSISDERYKKNIKELEYGLNEITQLNPVRFDYIDDASNDSNRVGFIAQQVKPLIPEAIQGSEEIKLGLSVTELIPALVNAIKELNAKVETLEAQILELQG